MHLFASVVFLLTVASTSALVQPGHRGRGRIQADSIAQRSLKYPVFTIDQPIDHFPDSSRYEPHSNETFKQQYYVDSSFYKPGGPVFLYLSGETSGPSRFFVFESGIIRILMEATNGLGVILENRYYGGSYPYKTSTTDQLRFLTTEQTIADNAYFAQHAVFPGLGRNVTAPDTPWIVYGGSLAGAQAAFTVKAYPDILWGGIASSGISQATLTFPQWYAPIQQFAPQDCIGSINGLVDKIDQVFATGNASLILELKRIFGLEALKDDRDFANTIAFPIGGPLVYDANSWQELNWDAPYGSDDFWLFCTNVTNLNAPANITSVDDILAPYTGGEPWTNLGNWANYIQSYIIPQCNGVPLDNTLCFGTQNASYWADVTNGVLRSYLYTACTEMGDYQAAAPSGPSLISRVIQANYTQQWCEWSFPPGEHNRIPPTPELWRYNDYGGYRVVADRLAHVDGDQDPWRDVCFHSVDLPSPLTTNASDAYLHPQLLIAGAGHHWDSFGLLDLNREPQFIRNAHLWEIRVVREWLRQFHMKY